MNILRANLARHLESAKLTYKDKDCCQGLVYYTEKIKPSPICALSNKIIAVGWNEKCDVYQVLREDGFGVQAEQTMLHSYPAYETKLSCLCLIQNKIFQNFSTEREFDSHLYMSSLGTRKWEPMLDERGISLQCCVSMVC